MHNSRNGISSPSHQEHIRRHDCFLRLKAATVLLVAVLLILIGAGVGSSTGAEPEKEGKGPAVSDEIRTRRLVIVGAEDKPLVELGSMRGQFPVFIMRSAAGERRMAAVVTPDDSVSLLLSDTQGKTQCSMSVKQTGNAHLVFRDEKGQPRASFTVQEKSGAPALDMLDDKGRTRMTVQLNEQGEPAIVLFDSQGNAIQGASHR